MEKKHGALTIEETEEVDLGSTDNPRITYLGKDMTQAQQDAIRDFLSRNQDVFVWKMEDMLGLDPVVACHRLNALPGAKPICQKLRKIASTVYQEVQEEVDKLLRAGFMREVEYSDWISNIVVVKKKNGKVRVCIDSTNLSKICPKDNFPSPQIDKLVDVIAEHEMMSFIDGYSGYNQIPLHPND